MCDYMMSLWQRPPGWGTKSCDARYRTRPQKQRGRTASRRLGPMVALLENRTLLSTATLTTLGISASSLVYGQSEVLTATVTTNPPSGTTPTGGTVSFMDGSATLVTEGLTNGSSRLHNDGLGSRLPLIDGGLQRRFGFGSSSTVAAVVGHQDNRGGRQRQWRPGDPDFAVLPSSRRRGRRRRHLHRRQH